MDNDSKSDYNGGMISQLGLLASLASIFGSLYIYFVQEEQLLGIFVGLWAPTLILISKEVDKMMGLMVE
jgi:nicotinamide riboside transporter PnuC|tara:strand:- start:260 stop:466 length:207 start_codon:yes stop_codon:yes gene_type:complete